jgi:hypothetical protein
VLVRPHDDGALAIGQLSHAWLSGQLARAWGNEQFGGIGPREEIVLGAQRLLARYPDESAMQRAFARSDPVTLRFTLAAA